MQLKPTFNQQVNDPTQYYYFTDSFSKEEIDIIDKGAEELGLQRAAIYAGDEGESVRKSNISWFPYTDNWAWLYDRMFGMAQEANNALWNFNIYNATDEIQYTVYDGNEKGHYGAHVDIGPESLSLRKISVVTQLSEEDDYEEGDLQLLQGDAQWVNVPRGRGITVVFPSYMYHRVVPVLSGTRKSLVLWVGGEHYK